MGALQPHRRLETGNGDTVPNRDVLPPSSASQDLREQIVLRLRGVVHPENGPEAATPPEPISGPAQSEDPAIQARNAIDYFQLVASQVLADHAAEFATMRADDFAKALSKSANHPSRGPAARFLSHYISDIRFGSDANPAAKDIVSGVIGEYLERLKGVPAERFVAQGKKGAMGSAFRSIDNTLGRNSAVLWEQLTAKVAA